MPPHEAYELVEVTVLDRAHDRRRHLPVRRDLMSRSSLQVTKGSLVPIGATQHDVAGHVIGKTPPPPAQRFGVLPLLSRVGNVDHVETRSAIT
jgi:hypothetical protein